jgi:hypothetical protein
MPLPMSCADPRPAPAPGANATTTNDNTNDNNPGPVSLRAPARTCRGASRPPVPVCVGDAYGAYVGTRAQPRVRGYASTTPASTSPEGSPRGAPPTSPGTVQRGKLDPMTAAVKALLEQAMQLTAEERAEVANALDGISADAPALSPDDLAAAWRPELDRRREELERGEVQTVDAREAIAGIRARMRTGQ